MLKEQKTPLFPMLGKVLSRMQQTVRVEGSILRDRALCKKAAMSSKTYGKLKKARA